VQNAADANVQTFCTKYGISPCDASSNLGFMQTGDVWRIDGLLASATTGGNDWFESSIPEPDVVLEDLINMLSPTINPSHDRTWFRNVFNDEAVVVEEPACADVNATRLSRADSCEDVKATTDHSEDWNVTYFETYKYVVNDRVNEQYVLHERGTDVRPARRAHPTAKFFEIPLRSVAVDETVGLTFLELLEERTTIKFVGSLQFVTSGCVRALVDQGLAETLESAFGGNATLRATQLASVDALIGGNSPNPDPKSFAFSSTADPGPLHRAEWIEFFALFFNKEYEASVLFNSTVSRYECHKRAALFQRSNKVVAWIAEYDFLDPIQYIVSTSDYKKQFVEDAGGIFFEPSQTVYTDQQAFLAAISDVDLVIDEDYVFDSNQATLELFCTKYGISPCDATASQKFMKNGDVWRVDGLKSAPTGGTDWFESSIPEPDVVLEDLINAFDPSLNPSHNRTWIRHVTTNEPVVIEEATCADVNAPRVSRADECSAVIVSVTPTDTEEDFTLVFRDLDFNDLPVKFVSDLLIEVAALVGVDVSNVRVVSLQAGSVIVSLAVEFGQNVLQKQAFSAFTRSNPTSTFSSSFQSTYGAFSINNDDDVSSECETKILEKCGLGARNCEVSDGSCGFLEDTTDNWCGGSCYGGDCCRRDGAKVAGLAIGLAVAVLLVVGLSSYCCYRRCKTEEAFSETGSMVKLEQMGSAAEGQKTETQVNKNGSIDNLQLNKHGSMGSLQLEEAKREGAAIV